MKRNLNDDTRQIKQFENAPIEKKAGWFLIISLVFLVLLLGYYLFS